MGEDEVYEVIPVASFERICVRCNLVFPKAIGCDCAEWAALAPVIPLRAAA